MLDTGDPECRYDRRALFPGGSCYPLSRDRGRDRSGKEKKDQLAVIFEVCVFCAYFVCLKWLAALRLSPSLCVFYYNSSTPARLPLAFPSVPLSLLPAGAGYTHRRGDRSGTHGGGTRVPA